MFVGVHTAIELLETRLLGSPYILGAKENIKVK